jgi:putative Mg2+ transporter-C (MgtC) family protein
MQEVLTALKSEFSDFSSWTIATKITFRLVLAGLLGGMLGYERESRGKAAGLRTHMLVAIGAALFIIAPVVDGMADDAISRVLQGLVAGIGFLGAGAILKYEKGPAIYGLTTAATIWFTAAIGVTCGLGRASTAILATALALMVLQVLGREEARLHLSHKRSDGSRSESEDEAGHP